jgi:hypothetical protein
MVQRRGGRSGRCGGGWWLGAVGEELLEDGDDVGVKLGSGARTRSRALTGRGGFEMVALKRRREWYVSRWGPGQGGLPAV